MNVTVHFIGICAHINNHLPLQPNGVSAVQEPPGSAMRVVLPNVTQGLLVAGTSVSPHFARLYIPPPFVASAPATIPGLTVVPENEGFWQMNGVQLELPSGSQGLTLAATYCLPSLTLTARAQQQLPLNLAVVKDGAAACVFLVTGGTLDTYMHNNAVLGQLTVTVESDQANLTVTQIWNQTVTPITLQPATIDGKLYDPFIFLSNTGAGKDLDVDFLLHYNVTSFMPDVPLTPQFACPTRNETPDESEMLAFLNTSREALTIGCSNSVYP